MYNINLMYFFPTYFFLRFVHILLFYFDFGIFRFCIIFLWFKFYLLCEIGISFVKFTLVDFIYLLYF